MCIFLTTKTWKEGSHYIVYDPELDVSSQDRSPIQAEEHLGETVNLSMEETKLMGTLERVVGLQGFLKRGHRWVAPQISVSSLEVPL